MNLDRYAKAIIGGLVAFLGAVQTGLADGHVTATEWIVAAVAAVTALGAVWAVPNANGALVNHDSRGALKTEAQPPRTAQPPSPPASYSFPAAGSST